MEGFALLKARPHNGPSAWQTQPQTQFQAQTMAGRRLPQVRRQLGQQPRQHTRGGDKMRPLQTGPKVSQPQSTRPPPHGGITGSLPEAYRQAQAGARERSARLAESNKNSAVKAKK